MEGGFLLDVVVSEGSSVIQLLSGEDESLLVWRDSFLVLDLGLDVLNRVRRLDIKGDGLSGQGLDEDLHGDVGVVCWAVGEWSGVGWSGRERTMRQRGKQRGF